MNQAKVQALQSAGLLYLTPTPHLQDSALITQYEVVLDWDQVYWGSVSGLR